MKVVQEIRNRKGLEDSEVLSAIYKAKEMTSGKSGFRCGEIRRNLHLSILVGHNIYTTSITLCDNENLAPAYFCNGEFWMTRNGCRVDLI